MSDDVLAQLAEWERMWPDDAMTDLTDIVDDDNADHIASFTLASDGHALKMTEGCDQYFTADLSAEQVDRLIAWLAEQRAKMT